MRCLFIGPLANHAVIGRVAAFVAAGCEVYLVNASSSDVDWLRDGYPISQAQIVDYWMDPFYRGESRIKRFTLEYLRSLAWIPEEPQLVGRLRALVRAINPCFAVVHYGEYAIHYARILKRVEPQLPAIDIVNLLPSHVNFREGISRLLRGWSGRLEESNYRHWLKRVEATVFASPEMLDFAQDKFGVPESKSYILPDYLPLAFQGQADGPLTASDASDGDPRVIFLGAPQRYGVVIDSIDDQFLALANEHIHVYSGALSERVRSTGFGHCYRMFSDQEVFAGRLAEFASRFDAALITYNVPRRQERFRSTYPTRFFSALTAGIPIAVRAGLLDACERFVMEHGIGFAYTSAADLRRKLMDKEMLSKCRRRAQECKEFMNAEAQGSELRTLLEHVLDARYVAL